MLTITYTFYIYELIYIYITAYGNRGNNYSACQQYGICFDSTTSVQRFILKCPHLKYYIGVYILDWFSQQYNIPVVRITISIDLSNNILKLYMYIYKISMLLCKPDRYSD